MQGPWAAPQPRAEAIYSSLFCVYSGLKAVFTASIPGVFALKVGVRRGYSSLMHNMRAKMEKTMKERVTAPTQSLGSKAPYVRSQNGRQSSPFCVVGTE